MTLDEMTALAAEVYGALGFLSVPDVRLSRRTAGALYYPSRNVISVGWNRRQVVLHELAHSLQSVYFGGGGEDHGPEFVTVNVELACAFLPELPRWQTYASLIGEAKAFGLRVREAPVLRERLERFWSPPPGWDAYR